VRCQVGKRPFANLVDENAINLRATFDNRKPWGMSSGEIAGPCANPRWPIGTAVMTFDFIGRRKERAGRKIGRVVDCNRPLWRNRR
jgi:hypothetical protein